MPERRKLLWLALAYGYWPAVYGFIYLPFLVPGLSGWRSFPPAVPLVAAAVFASFCIAAGMKLKAKEIFLNALGIAPWLLLIQWIGVEFNWPGFRESWTPGNWQFWVELLVVAAGAGLLLGIGRILNRAGKTCAIKGRFGAGRGSVT